jgi:hypothetical protein
MKVITFYRISGHCKRLGLWPRALDQPRALLPAAHYPQALAQQGVFVAANVVKTWEG